MKNVTITVDDAALEWTRIEAAKRNTSVSRLVGEMLLEKMQREDAYARAEREWLADDVTFTSGAQPPSQLSRRAEIYAERQAGNATRFR
jgi:hypothetical protein